MRMACLLATAFLLVARSAVMAVAAEPITPPAMYPPDTWAGRSAAVVRVLDKLDAHVETLTIPAGQRGGYKSLGVAVRSCLQHPPGLAPDSAAFLSVQDANAAPVFSGWMFSAEPFIAVFESPVYGVQLVSCGGGDVAPAAPPLLPPAPAATAAPGPDTAPDAAAPPAADGPDPVYPSGAPDPAAPSNPAAPPNPAVSGDGPPPPNRP